eukprot:scaffold307879_cov17-Tisochrysis_lutea.AAC.2
MQDRGGQFCILAHPLPAVASPAVAWHLPRWILLYLELQAAIRAIRTVMVKDQISIPILSCFLFFDGACSGCRHAKNLKRDKSQEHE